MESIFQSFCSFGGGMKDAGGLMDGAKFNKFCRDMKILDKKLTAIDADIIFAQVKGKSERKINFNQFLEVIQLMSEKKYHGEKNPEQILQSKILEGKGRPSISGTTKAINSDAVERMTDTSQYTGTHKERFDESGKGKGLSGRETNAKGRGSMPALTSSQAGYVDGYKNAGTYSSPKQKRDSTKVSDVTDRLTDTSKYTGAHKHRFDATGHGLGMAGRDLPAKGQGMSPGSVGAQQGYVQGYRNEGSYSRK